VTTPGYPSTFNGKQLKMAKVELAIAPAVVVETTRVISSAGVCRMINNDVFMTLGLRPDKQEGPVPAAELFFLLDVSGSMSGTKIRNAREALDSIIQLLPGTNYFNIVFFNDHFTYLYEESQLATKANIREAVERLQDVKAGGGTDLFAPLEFVYGKPPREGFVRQLFVLTDGAVSREADILHLISTHRSDHRIFSLGIGADVARAFVEEIATRTGGNAAFVDPTNIQKSVGVQVAASGSPAIVNVQVHIGDDEAIEISPFPVSPLFHNRITHVYLRRKNSGNIPSSILVTGMIGTEHFEQTFDITPTTLPIDMMKMFAFFNIKDLETRIPPLRGPRVEALRANVIELSKEARLVSAFTAMFTLVDGVELHLQPSLGQAAFGMGMQPFTQDQSRMQGCFAYQCQQGP
jgi:hypothetical protein